jgi:hypothetical protein
MSLTVPDHFVTQFGKNFEHTVQQKASRLKRCAIVNTGCTGEAKTHNLILPGDDEEITGQRYKKIALQDLDTEKRWNTPREFRRATGESSFDETLLAPTIMPGGSHVQAHAATFARRCDKVLIEGLLGTNYKGANGSTAVEILAGHIVPTDYVHTGADADSALTVAKIIEAVKLLRQSEAWNDEARAMGIKLCGVMNADLNAALLNDANAATGSRLFSKDFLPPVLDENGMITSFLGVNWIHYEGIPKAVVAGDNIVKAAVWTSDGLHFDIWKDLQTHIDVRPDLDHAVQFLSKYAFNACRHQEEQVVQINCLDLSA